MFVLKIIFGIIGILLLLSFFDFLLRCITDSILYDYTIGKAVKKELKMLDKDDKNHWYFLERESAQTGSLFAGF